MPGESTGAQQLRLYQLFQKEIAETANDRILTVGGVIGTVVSVKANKVLVKVDESTNTKMTFLKTSIQRIVTDDQDLAAAGTSGK